jgi:hypothetical protein
MEQSTRRRRHALRQINIPLKAHTHKFSSVNGVTESDRIAVSSRNDAKGHRTHTVQQKCLLDRRAARAPNNRRRLSPQRFKVQ